MAEIIDDNEVSELEAVEQQDAQAAEVAKVPTEDDVPDEFKALSKSDLAGMLKHARKELGRQNAEVGEVRKLADELLKSQLKPRIEPEPVKEVDFFENPQEAIRQAVETNPRVLAAEQYALNAQKAQALQALAQKHPDYSQVVNQDAEFAAWVKASKIRTQLFQAAENFNLDAADELLSTYKQLKSINKPQVKEPPSAEEKAARTSSMQAASVDTGGSGESGKKVYRRADLIRLKMRDPAKFSDMQDEIDKAYREGRVK
jgi:hypothetical protein